MKSLGASGELGKNPKLPILGRGRCLEINAAQAFCWDHEDFVHKHFSRHQGPAPSSIFGGPFNVGFR